MLSRFRVISLTDGESAALRTLYAPSVASELAALKAVCAERALQRDNRTPKRRNAIEYWRVVKDWIDAAEPRRKRNARPRHGRGLPKRMLIGCFAGP